MATYNAPRMGGRWFTYPFRGTHLTYLGKSAEIGCSYPPLGEG